MRQAETDDGLEGHARYLLGSRGSGPWAVGQGTICLYLLSSGEDFWRHSTQNRGQVNRGGPLAHLLSHVAKLNPAHSLDS